MVLDYKTSPRQSVYDMQRCEEHFDLDWKLPFKSPDLTNLLSYAYSYSVLRCITQLSILIVRQVNLLLLTLKSLFNKVFYSPVSFVDDEVFPRQLFEGRFLANQHLVGGHQYIPACGHHRFSNEFL